MSAPANRRSFLRGLTTLPLIGGGVTLTGTDAHADAELVDLWRQREAAVVAERAASAHHDALDDAIELPAWPAAVFLQEGDHALGLAVYCERNEDAECWYPYEHALAERRGWRRKHWRWQERPAEPADNLPDHAQTVTFRVPLRETQARADEIADAWDRHKAACATVMEESGFNAAAEAWERADDALSDVELAIYGAEARTFAGLSIKARLAQAHLDEGLEVHPRLAVGLVRDILAMGGAACAYS